MSIFALNNEKKYILYYEKDKIYTDHNGTCVVFINSECA